MTTELTILRSSGWKLWPVFLAVICGQMLGILLARWLPFHFAMGLAWFVAWFFAALMLARRFTPRWGIPAWLASVLIGAGAGLSVTLLSFFLPWK